jgi:YegS/Rv2252/BmrU family lipid kinase
MQATTKKNIAILCNPFAGNGKALQLADKICKRLSTDNVSFGIYKEKWPDDFDEHSDVFIVGGDGTLNFFINNYPNVPLPLVIFNGGTGNDFHWLLYGKKSFAGQMETALTAEPKPIDIGRCNEKYFINGVGIGFDGAVAKSLTGKKKSIGKSAFLVAILQKIFFYRSKNYEISSAEINESGHKLLLGIANGRRAGGGFHIAPESEPADGLLDLIIVDALTPIRRLKYLPVIEKGKHLHLPFIKYLKTKKVLIESDEPMQAHLDGEYYSEKKMEIEIVPGKFLFRY